MKRLRPEQWGGMFFCLALLLQLWHTDHYFTWSGSDRNQQLVGALQLQSGEGFSVPMASSKDLSLREAEKLQGWPPGFRILVKALYRLTQDWFWSSRIFNALGVLLLFWSAHLLLIALKPYLSPWVYPAFFAFWMFSYTPFHYTIGVEEWALACFLLACWVLVQGLKQVETDPWHEKKTMVLILLFLGFGVWFRYLYFPLLLIPVSVACFLYYKRRINLKQLAVDLILAGTVGLGILWALKPSYTLGGHWWDTFLVDQWYPEHLLKMDAFPLKAWAYFGIGGILNKWPELPLFVAPTLKIGLFLASLAVLWSLWRGYRENSDFVWQQFQMTCLVATLGTVALLIFQSLGRAPEWHDGLLHWTYVQETRYYAPVLISIQILGFSRAFSASLPAWEKWAWRFLLIGAFAYGSIHSSYRFLDGSERETRWASSERWLKESHETVLEKTQNGETVVWIYGATIYEEDEAHLAALAGASMIPEIEFDRDYYPSSQPIVLLTTCPALPQLKKAFQSQQWEVIAESSDRLRLTKKISPKL